MTSCIHLVTKLTTSFRKENTHISATVAFENAQIKLVSENGQDQGSTNWVTFVRTVLSANRSVRLSLKQNSLTEIKKGEKYQIQMDLGDDLPQSCKEMKIKIFGTWKKDFGTWKKILAKILNFLKIAWYQKLQNNRKFWRNWSFGWCSRTRNRDSRTVFSSFSPVEVLWIPD